MNNKSILMPHICQKIGWGLLLISVLLNIVMKLFIHDIDTAWTIAKVGHFIFILSLFLICMSKEKVEDEMISSYRLRAFGITFYVFFIIFMLVSLILELQPAFLYSKYPEDLRAFVNQVFLTELPLLLFALYYALFRWMLWKSKKQ